VNRVGAPVVRGGRLGVIVVLVEAAETSLMALLRLQNREICSLAAQSTGAVLLLCFFRFVSSVAPRTLLHIAYNRPLG
jgi:hypothetical protein